MSYLSHKELNLKKRITFTKANKIKFFALLFISIILFQLPIVTLNNVIYEANSNLENLELSFPPEDEMVQFSNSSEEKLSSENAELSFPPEDEVIQFSNSPDIVFDIKYNFVQKKVQMNINLRNNLTSSISLLNLWIQVNKSDLSESILISATQVITGFEKLSLSTFDTNHSMVFHLKLYEGEIIEPDEEYDIILTWIDPDDLFAQYNPNLLYNDLADDIEAYFEYSTDEEESQLFPLIERCLLYTSPSPRDRS